MIEREIKLVADDGVSLPDLAALVPGISVGPQSTLHLTAVYYDTPTLSLARSGVTLRARIGEPGPIWTLKLPSVGADAGLSRPEITFDAPLGPVPSEARVAVRAYVRSQPLGPVVRLRTERAEIPLEFEGTPLGTLADDAVVADGDSEPVMAFREIELELASGDVSAKVVKRLVGLLRKVGCRDDAPLPKAIRALGDQALGPPDVVTGKIGKRATTRDVVCHTIAKSVAQLVEHHAGTWLGDDPEDLHQFRVGARRLRSDLRTFAPLLDEQWTVRLRDELKWLGAEVGLGRDADVLAERLRAQVRELPADDAGAVADLLRRLEGNRDDARRHVEAALASDRYVELLDALCEASHDQRFAPESIGLADEPARDALVKIVRKPWHKLKTAADALTLDSPDPEFHAVRIRAKRARYAVEAVAPVVGGEARRCAAALANVQSVLGDHQDTTLAEAWLRTAANELPSSRLVVGELLMLDRLERQRLRRVFESVWRRASRRKLSEWLDERDPGDRQAK